MVRNQAGHRARKNPPQPAPFVPLTSFALTPDPVPFDLPTLRGARREVLRLLRRDWVRPIRRGPSLRPRAFERLDQSTEDLLLAESDGA